MASEKKDENNVLDRFLQQVQPFEKQSFKITFGKRETAVQLYRGAEFILTDSRMSTRTETLPWQHYNAPGWLEFNFILKGTIYQSQAGLFTGQLLSEGSHHFLFNPDAAEENKLVGSGDYRIITIYMRVEKAVYLFNEYLPEFPNFAEKLQAGKPFFQQSPDRRFSERIAHILHHLWEAPASEKLEKLYYESVVNELFCLQCESLLQKPEKPSLIKLRNSDIEKLHEATRLLANSLPEPPSLEWLAKACQLNEYKLKAGFRQLFGTTVHQYVQHLRMEQARQLIRDTDKTMSEIAYELGYTHSQHFQRAFKETFGITPNSLRYR